MNRVTNKIEVVGPKGQDFRVETFKLDGMYYLETSQVIKGIQQDFKSQKYYSKSDLFRYRNLALDYLKYNGLW